MIAGIDPTPFHAHTTHHLLNGDRPCTECGDWVMEYQAHYLNKGTICVGCCSTCPFCGEWMDDEGIAALGARVKVWDWLTGGKVVAHAMCAGTEHVRAVCGLGAGWQFEDAEKEEIEGMLGKGEGCNG